MLGCQCQPQPGIPSPLTRNSRQGSMFRGPGSLRRLSETVRAGSHIPESQGRRGRAAAAHLPVEWARAAAPGPSGNGLSLQRRNYQKVLYRARHRQLLAARRGQGPAFHGEPVSDSGSSPLRLIKFN